MYRKTYTRIDGGILENNVKEIIKKYDKYKYYIGVVKNNAYHHGIKVINNLIQGGVNYLAVSSLEEALSVRKYNSEIPVLVLEPIDLEFIDDAINGKVTLTVADLEYLKQLNQLEVSFEIPIHLKVDSGMNRLGLKSASEMNEAVKIIHKNNKLYLEGIYSHFATTGVLDYHYDKQLKTFKEIVADIDLKSIPIVHLDRSLTMVTHEKLDFVNGVRLGIVLYGFSGSRNIGKGLKNTLRNIKRNLYLKRHHVSKTILQNDLKLQTAFSLYSEVVSIRKVKRDECVGYNASYKVKNDAYIATLPIGYADGVTKEFGFVSIRGKKYPIVADSMDMTMVLVDETIKIKDKVEIFGDTIPIREVASRLGTNVYHLFNQISNRVPRVHIEDEDEMEIQY